MNWIDDNVAVGNWMDAFRVGALRREGIDLIIDARTLFHRNWRNFHHYPDVKRVRRAGNMLVSLAELDAKVLVRCRHGRDRTPFLAMLYVSKRYNKTVKEAYEMVKEKRPQTVLHWEWVEMLEK